MDASWVGLGWLEVALGLLDSLEVVLFFGQQKKRFWSLSNFRGALGDVPKMTQKYFKVK